MRYKRYDKFITTKKLSWCIQRGIVLIFVGEIEDEAGSKTLYFFEHLKNNKTDTVLRNEMAFNGADDGYISKGVNLYNWLDEDEIKTLKKLNTFIW